LKVSSAGERANLVAATGIAGIDGQIAAGDLQHGVAHIVQRLDDVAGDRHHGADGQGKCRGQKHELHHQRAQRFGMSGGDVVLGRVECGVGDTDRGSETSDRYRAPLVGRHFRLFAGQSCC
jgi:hypothetical protein